MSIPNVKKIEDFFFKYRNITVAVLVFFTAVMGSFAVQLKMEAGFEKQIPIGHEYTNTYNLYKDVLFGANRITVVVKSRKGSLWTQEALSRLYSVTQAVSFLPNIDKLGVQSLWTPNTFVNEITEEGFRADPIIPGTVLPKALDAEKIQEIRQSTQRGGYIGTLVSRDETSAMITADLNETDAEGHKLDYISFNHLLEDNIRKPFEDDNYEIEIIGFCKQVGDIADGARGVLRFCGLALVLTAFAVFWYCGSVRFTILPIVCSLSSLIWQFGALRLLGYGLDPLAVLVPFLVFSIGVSHGVQQINFIVRELCKGNVTAEQAARASFSGLLIPGTLALITAFVSFVTLLVIPIPMVRELAITASLGVGFKIVTNLLMLPLVASYFHFTQDFAEKFHHIRDRRAAKLKLLSKLLTPRKSYMILVLTAIVFTVSVWESRDRVVGTLQPGAPELRPDSRFNLDALAISKGYDVGLDWLTIVFEATGNDCGDPHVGLYQDDFVESLQSDPNIVSIASYSNMLKTYNEGYNEGNPAMYVVPIDPTNYGALSAEINRIHGYMNKSCKMTAVHLYLRDHKATTITHVLDRVKTYRTQYPFKGVNINVMSPGQPEATADSDNLMIRLAAGNAGVLAATNDEVSKSELPMMLYVYLAIVVLVFIVYRDFRAMISCCLPLTVSTFIGYWFMKELEIGLTVATLPVMVLAVGIGVDYALYIYNRIQLHMGEGMSLQMAMEKALEFEAMATIFTALTLSVGVATWSFSALKFQADMGELLAFMFIVNLVMAMSTLPALAFVLERWFPRKRPVTASKLFHH